MKLHFAIILNIFEVLLNDTEFCNPLRLHVLKVQKELSFIIYILRTIKVNVYVLFYVNIFSNVYRESLM